jgi:hypothetical protein
MADNAATTASAAANLNVTNELNISFENLSYNAKVGFFKRREFTLNTNVIYIYCAFFFVHYTQF